MPAEAVIIVSDAHLGPAARTSASSFHAFLKQVPSLGRRLVINGDLFDFWFEYRRVIPRDAFPTLAALANLRAQGVELTVTGGNHDRWGGDFWRRDLGAEFYPAPVDLDLVGFRTFLAHGDGLAESRRASRFMHHVTRLPLTAALFRLIHPDLGYWLADRMSGSLAEQTKDAVSLAGAAEVQRVFAMDLLEKRRDLDLVILSHTHRTALAESGPRRWYLNPGAWLDGGSYALLTRSGPELRTFKT